MQSRSKQVFPIHVQITILFLILGSILFLGCTSTSYSDSTQTNSDLLITEEQHQTVTTIDVIRINNCGGKGNSEIISERSFAVKIEGGIEVQGGVDYLQGSVSGKYGQYRNYLKSLKVIAPPGTNMVFEIKWTELEWSGTLSVNGQSGTYNVRAPIEVEQTFSQDKGDCITLELTPSEHTSEIVNSTEVSLNCDFINELVKKADVITKIYEGQSLAGIQARLIYAIDVPIGWIVQKEGKDYFGPIHFDSGVVASFWSPNSCRPLIISKNVVSSDLRDIAAKTLGYSDLDSFMEAFEIPSEIKPRIFVCPNEETWCLGVYEEPGQPDFHFRNTTNCALDGKQANGSSTIPSGFDGIIKGFSVRPCIR